MLKDDIINSLCQQHLPLAKIIRDKGQIQGSSIEAYSFIIAGLKLLYPKMEDTKIALSITDDDDDAGFDAIVFLMKKREIAIFNFERRIGFAYKNIKSFKQSIEEILLDDTVSINGGGLNARVVPILKRARKLLEKGWKIRIFLVTKKISSANQKSERLILNLKISFDTVIDYKFLDIHSLVEEALHLKSFQHNYVWQIKLTEMNRQSPSGNYKISIKDSSGRIKSLFAMIQLKDILQLQREFACHGADLFDDNVRGLKKNKGFLQKITETIDEHPDFFYLYHNGITFSCDAIVASTRNFLKITNPQIINGYQTVGNLYDKYRDNLNAAAIKKAYVLCRFHALKNNAVEKVCEATNTQSKINLWDLRSNDEIQKIFEQALSVSDIEYHRKITNRASGKVFITDLAQWIYSCRYGKPAEAKNKKASLFDVLPEDSLYKKIFNESIKLEELVRI